MSSSLLLSQFDFSSESASFRCVLPLQSELLQEKIMKVFLRPLFLLLFHSIHSVGGRSHVIELVIESGSIRGEKLVSSLVSQSQMSHGLRRARKHSQSSRESRMLHLQWELRDSRFPLHLCSSLDSLSSSRCHQTLLAGEES